MGPVARPLAGGRGSGSLPHDIAGFNRLPCLASARIGGERPASSWPH